MSARLLLKAKQLSAELQEEIVDLKSEYDLLHIEAVKVSDSLEGELKEMKTSCNQEIREAHQALEDNINRHRIELSEKEQDHKNELRKQKEEKKTLLLEQAQVHMQDLMLLSEGSLDLKPLQQRVDALVEQFTVAPVVVKPAAVEPAPASPEPVAVVNSSIASGICSVLTCLLYAAWHSAGEDFDECNEAVGKALESLIKLNFSESLEDEKISDIVQTLHSINADSCSDIEDLAERLTDAADSLLELIGVTCEVE